MNMRERSETDDGADSILDRAWDALETGDAQLALELARSAPIDGEDASQADSRWILEASAQLELDDLPAAREALRRASDGRTIEEDADLCWTAAEIALREWKLDEARRLFERTAELERTTPALGRLALCADALGDFELADRYLREAERMDPEGWVFPPRLSEEELQDVLDEAIGKLEEDFQEALEETPILIEPMPRRELLAPTELAQTPPDMLGLFVGASRLERSGEDASMPPSIHLFQRNLERACADRDDLVQELRVTLYHEIGHMLGFDEDGVDRMGLA
jgi:predicted Zn-dependent protease with MMP-like domain